MESSTVFTPEYGMCYSPEPLKNEATHGENKIYSDDYMGEWAESMWKTRGDLSIIRKLNMTMVRMYGNDMSMDHSAFLDEADSLGLKVVVAFSDFPYTQDKKGRCALAEPYDCSSEIQDQYEHMLTKGFTRVGGDGNRYYHPAVKAIILVNEPELKFSHEGDIFGASTSKGYYTKALISALDGALAAERSMRIAPHGSLPPFTITHSFAACSNCLASTRGNQVRGQSVANLNAIPFMYDFAVAMLAPSTYGYTPNPDGDLRAALQNRFLLGFNTQNQADAICIGSLTPLLNSFLSNVPVWVGEYKATYQAGFKVHTRGFEDDLRGMRAVIDGDMEKVTGHCRKARKLGAVSVFEFQVAYDKGPGDNQMVFGSYELGLTAIGHTEAVERTNWTSYPVYCLRQKRNKFGESWVEPVARVFGGEAHDDSDCPQDPDLPVQ